MGGRLSARQAPHPGSLASLTSPTLPTASRGEGYAAATFFESPELSRAGVAGEAAVEAVAFGGHVDEQRRRRKPWPARRFEAPALFDECLRPHHVDVGQRTARERREAEAQDRADVSLAHVGQHALLEAARGFERLDAKQAMLQV